MRLSLHMPVAVLAAPAILALGAIIWHLQLAPAEAQAARTAGEAGVAQWAMIAAAVAAGLSALAAGYAVAVVGSAAVGALAEKPELMGRVLILNRAG